MFCKRKNGEGGIRTPGTSVHRYDGLAISNQKTLKNCNDKDLRNPKNQTDTNTDFPSKDLHLIIEKWDDLPKHIKDAIKTLIQAVS